jgi:hypothetical protein
MTSLLTNNMYLNALSQSRGPVYYSNELADPLVLHFDTYDKHRLLEHFYNFVKFTDPAIDNYYKRFVR